MSENSKTIWKYELVATQKQTLMIPEGAEFLYIDVQHEIPQIWMLLNPLAPQMPKTFITIGTGHPISDKLGRYLGTYMLQDGFLVFHVFEGEER